tara:strand:- start:13118 stop:14128 length:1011 start_codon:yes stop_codon:yes gene_type:complete
LSYRKIIFIALVNITFLITVISCSFLQEKRTSLKERKTTNKKKSEYNSFSLYLQKIENYKNLGKLPLIDVEVSLSQWPNIQKLVNEMDKGGVALAGITSPKKNEIRKAINRFPERFFPLTQESSEKDWEVGKSSFTRSITKQINSGALGIGKIKFQDKKKASLKKTEKDTLRNIVYFASKMKVPTIITSHPSNQFLDLLEKNLQKKPEAKIIWTQIGSIEKPHYLPSYGHGLIRALTIRHPNLIFTITTKNYDLIENKFILRKNHLYDSYDYFSIDWRNLIEAKISHFMFGVKNEKNKTNYSQKVNRFRRNILRNFSYHTQHRIAYKNAIKIFFKR